MIYLDNAATTVQKPECVAEAMLSALKCAGNSARGVYGYGLNAGRILYEARERIAELFGCTSPARVIFTSGVTESLNAVLNGLLNPGDRVITTELEHNSVLRPLYRLAEERQIALDFLPTDSSGNPVYDALGSVLCDNTRAIVCTHASNLTGNLVDLKKIRCFAAAHGLQLIVDAAQTAGSYDIDTERDGIDVLCFTGHKGLMGPQGTGGFCLRDGIELRPWKVGGTGVQSHLKTQPEQYPVRLEAGTMNTPGIAGLSAAVSFIAETGVVEIHRAETALMRRFYDAVRVIPGVTVYGDFSADRAPIVALNIRNYDSGAVADALAEQYGICVRAGAHCAPLMHRALGTESQGAVRFSFSCFNTPEEVDAAVKAVREIAE